MTTDAAVAAKLNTLAPLYASVSRSGFGNLLGDALEVVVFKCLERIQAASRRYTFQGHFLLGEPKNALGRYKKVSPPKHLAGHATDKELDFIQYGYDAGPAGIECKNLREWVYPTHNAIRELIVKAAQLQVVPVLVTRRLHYTTRTNLLEPAGIIAHESLFQYYPADKAELAASVSHKRSLGFTDVRATEEPHPRTVAFFSSILPQIIGRMSDRWFKNAPVLVAYANNEMNLAQLYTEIGSPAGGKWQDYE